MFSDDLLQRTIEATFGAVAPAALQPATVDTIPSTGGGAFNTTVRRVTGGSGVTAWSVVVKHIDADPSRPDWDREANVLADEEWLDQHLPAGLTRPRLLAHDRSSASVTLVLEDLASSRPLTLDDVHLAARLLWAFNRSGADPRPWWSRNFLAIEHATLADHPDRIAIPFGDPTLEQLRQQLVGLTAVTNADFASLELVPTGPAHLDAYSRNLLPTDQPDTIGIVDWANAGEAPLGTDLATLFTLTLDYLDAPVDAIADLGHGIVDPIPDGPVREAFWAAARRRHLAMMMNALPMVQAQDPAVSAIVGKPLDAILEQWIAVGDHLLSVGRSTG